MIPYSCRNNWSTLVVANLLEEHGVAWTTP